jgi:hypothetical protein
LDAGFLESGKDGLQVLQVLGLRIREDGDVITIDDHTIQSGQAPIQSEEEGSGGNR